TSTWRLIMRPSMRNARLCSFWARMWPVSETSSPSEPATAVTVRTGRISAAGCGLSQAPRRARPSQAKTAADLTSCLTLLPRARPTGASDEARSQYRESFPVGLWHGSRRARHFYEGRHYECPFLGMTPQHLGFCFTRSRASGQLMALMLPDNVNVRLILDRAARRERDQF